MVSEFMDHPVLYLLTYRIKIHQNFTTLWFGLDMHAFANSEQIY